ncbi:MAG: DUF5301 domain-containing protein [Dehalobacterium sp.]
MFSYTLFPKILNMSLTAGIVIILVMLIRLPMKKAPKVFSYALWAVVLFRLLCPVSFSSDFSLLGLFNSPTVTNGSITYIPSDIVHTANPQVDLPLPRISQAINESLPQGEEQLVADPLEAPMAFATLLWLFGVAAMFTYSIVSVVILKRHLKSARHIKQNIYEAENLKTPFVLGIFRPRIFIPDGLAEEEKRYIIRHEQTHIRRLDHIIKPFAFLVLSIHWFNPLVWIAFFLMGTDMELSCDERVIKEMGGDIKKAYSLSLLSLTTEKRILNGSTLAFGEGNVKGRIKNVLNYKKPSFWIVIAAVIAVACVSIGLTVNPKQEGPGMDNTDSDVSISYIQIEITRPGSKIIIGRVITDKGGYKAGDTVSVVVGESVTYDVDSLKTGDWIDVDYYMVKEKHPPEFTAHHISRITGDNYPTAFTLFENGKVIKTNTLQNSRVASEMPSLILSGSTTGRPSVNDIPEVPRYLKIDLGADGEKIYYTFEENGKCYIENPYIEIYEISRETFDELIQYVYKGEITHGRASQQTKLEPIAARWSPEKTVSVDMTELDYASDDIVIFHDYFGLFVYDLNTLEIVRSLDLKPLNCHQTQGDNYCEVSVSMDGNTVQLHPMSNENMYVYTVSDNTLLETAYQPMEERFSSFVPIEDVIDSSKLANYSHTAVKFDTYGYGYLHTTDGTIGKLSYVRDDMMYRLFGLREN